jgi:CRP-like cAMP-binding protein
MRANDSIASALQNPHEIGYHNSDFSETFSTSNFVARGLTHMTATVTSKLAKLSKSTTNYKHHYSNSSHHPKKHKHKNNHKKKHHRHHHDHHDHRHSHDEESEEEQVEEDIRPLTEEEILEFDAVGEHVEHLRKMHPRLRRQIYSAMHHVHVKAGDLVIMEGEPADDWYILLRGSLQCIAQASQYGGATVPNGYQTDRNKAEEMQQQQQQSVSSTPLNADEIIQQHKDRDDQIGTQVSYYFGHGQHISGLVVGMFHPGDAFGERAFDFAREQVEHSIRDEKPSTATAGESSVVGISASLTIQDGSQNDGEMHHTRHPHDRNNEDLELQPAPKQAKRSASVVALEDSELLKVCLQDLLEIQHRFRRWILDSIFACLRPLPNFQDLDNNELNELARHCKLHHINRNKVVLFPDQALSCFVVKRGSLRVLVKRKGEFLELANLSVGNTFGGARLSQGCTRAGDGVCLVTSQRTVQNEIIEIEPAFFFRYCIRQHAERRQRWAASLDLSFPFLAKSFVSCIKVV